MRATHDAGTLTALAWPTERDDDVPKGQMQPPRFASCMGAPGGWLRIRLVRCTNAAPIGHQGQVSKVVAAQCVCALASQPGTSARSDLVGGDDSGGAVWDELLWLPLPVGDVTLSLELRLSVRDAGQRTQCAGLELLPRTGTASVPLRGASGNVPLSNPRRRSNI